MGWFEGTPNFPRRGKFARFEPSLSFSLRSRNRARSASQTALFAIAFSPSQKVFIGMHYCFCRLLAGLGKEGSGIGFGCSVLTAPSSLSFYEMDETTILFFRFALESVQ